MIASHELNFGSRIIFKRLYVVLVLQGNDLWNSFSLSVFPIAMVIATVVSYLFVQGCRRCYIDRFAWLLSQSLLAHIAADDCGARIILPLA